MIASQTDCQSRPKSETSLRCRANSARKRDRVSSAASRSSSSRPISSAGSGDERGQLDIRLRAEPRQ